jgi:hypothetical protein
MDEKPTIRPVPRINTQDLARVALRRVRLWQDSHGQTVPNCPICEAPGLSVIDRSTRPYAEWYELSCRHCGLEDRLHVASASRNP